MVNLHRNVDVVWYRLLLNLHLNLLLSQSLSQKQEIHLRHTMKSFSERSES